MEWLTANGFWILIFIAFVAMHMFAHGGHGSHGGGDRQRSQGETGKDDAQGRLVNTNPGGHRH